MSAPKRAGFKALLASAALSAPAAGVTKLQGVGQASLGVTDNVQSAPEDPPPGVPERSADVFAVLSPGLVLARATPSETQTVRYTFAASIYYDQWRSSAFSNRLDWLGHFVTSSRTELLLSASASHDRPYTSATLADAGTQAVAATLPTTDSYLLLRADQTLTFDIAPEWRAWQGATSGLQTPIDPDLMDELPVTYEAGARLGGEHVLRTDAFGPEVRSRYTRIENSVDSGGTRRPVLAQIVDEYLAIWRHDWSREISSRVEAGAVHVIPLSRGGVFWHPAGLAALAYVRDEGSAELSYSHTVQTNLVLGQLVLADEVALRLGLPLDEHDHVRVSSSAGYQRGRLLGADGELETEVDVWLADAGVAWDVEDHVTLSARYQHVTQVSGADVPPLPLSYAKNTVLASITFKWPPDDEMPRRYRAPVRVDRSDTLRQDEPAPLPVPRR